MIGKLVILLCVVCGMFPGLAQAEALWVIGAKSEKAILGALGGDEASIEGWTLKKVCIKRSMARACFERGEAKPFCILLEHPEQAGKNARRVGSVSLRAENPSSDATSGKLFEAVARRMKKVDWRSLWFRSKEEYDAGDAVQSLDMDHLLRMADALASQREFELSLAAIRMAEQIQPEDALLRLMKIRRHIMKGEIQCARELLDVPEDAFPDLRVGFAAERAKIYALEENISKSLEILKNLQTDGAMPEGACRAVIETGKLIGEGICDLDAQDFYMQALEFIESCDDLWQVFSETMMDTGRSVELLEWLDKSLKKQPENTQRLRQKAMALWRLKRFEESMEAWRALYDLSPDPKVLENHTSLIERLDDKKTLQDQMVARMKTHPDDKLARHTLAVLHCHFGRYQTCEEEVDTLLLDSPDDTVLFLYAAISRYELGDWEGAKETLDNLHVKRNKNILNRELYYYQAMIYHREDLEKSLHYLDILFGRPIGTEEPLAQYAKALEIRKRLLKGETIWEWLPDEEYPVDPDLVPWIVGTLLPAGAAGVVIFVLLVLLFVKTRKNT